MEEKKFKTMLFNITDQNRYIGEWSSNIEPQKDDLIPFENKTYIIKKRYVREDDKLFLFVDEYNSNSVKVKLH